jgi:hypothetical protein
VSAIQKATQRLLSRGLLEVAGSSSNPMGGSPLVLFQAVLSRGECQKVCPTEAKALVRLESTVGQPLEVSNSCPTGGEQLDNQLDTPTPCPTANPSDTNGSAPVGHVLDISPREERSSSELDTLKQAAMDAWS